MVKSLLQRFRLVCILTITVFALLFVSCDIDIGLGSAVDTEPPSIEFSENTSDPKSNAIIRGKFAIRGTWKDDGALSGVKVYLTNASQGRTVEVNGSITLPPTPEENGTWIAVINPFAPTAAEPDGLDLIDGIYDVRVEIKDKGEHVSIITRSYTIDNTAPVLILSRPSSPVTASEEKIESYGQFLTFEGQAADDNDVEYLEVQFYNKDEPEKLLKTKIIKNIPPTISLDVAKFLDTEDDTYSKIYGDDKVGEKKYICKIFAYDGARAYPVSGQRTEADDKGNVEDSYILWTDWEQIVNDFENNGGSNLKVPDLYHIKSRTYNYIGGRAVIDARSLNSIWNSVEGKLISESILKLNPENSPTYTISGLALGAITRVENDTALTVQLAKGLDKISLDTDNMKVYLLACDDNGKEIAGAERLYPTDSQYSQRGDGQFLTKITKTLCKNAAGENVNLVYGQTYIIGVEGRDTAGNTILPSFDGKKFIINFKAKSIAPEVDIVSPSETISYFKKGKSLTIKGTVAVPDGYPNLKIKCKKDAGDSKEIYKYTFTDADKISATEYLITYGFEYTISPVNSTEENVVGFDQNKSATYDFDITSDLDEMTTPVYTKTVLYDIDGPKISVDSMLPVAYKYPEDEEQNPVDEYLNGNVTMKVSVIDDYDKVEKDKSWWQIVADDLPGTITEKHYFSNPTKEDFIIDTKAITNGAKDISIKIHAEDRAGNFTETVNEYKIDQSTDNPVIRPYIASDLTLKFQSPQEIKDALNNAELKAAGKNKKSILTTGSPLQIRMIDDDGIKSYEFKISDKETGLNLKKPAGFNQEITGTPTENILSYTLPTIPGKYKFSLSVTDKYDNTTAKEFWVLVSSPAPVVTISETTPQNKIITLAPLGETARVNNTITNVISIDSGYENFTVTRKEDGCDAVTLKFEKVEIPDPEDPENSEKKVIKYVASENSGNQILTNHSFSDTFTPSANRTSNKVTYTVSDENDNAGERVFEYYVDSTKPVVDAASIVVPTNRQTESASFRFLADAADTAENNKNSTKASGISKLQYTFDSNKADANIVNVPNVSSLSETVKFADLTYAFATEGKKKIYIRAFDDAGNIGDWAEKEFMFDKAAPALAVQKYKRGSESEQNFTDGSVNKSLETGELFILSGTASDGNGIANFKVYQSKNTKPTENNYGTQLTDISIANIDSEGNWTITGLPRNDDGSAMTELTSGTYYYTIVVEDKSAYTPASDTTEQSKTSPAQVTVNIDKTPPKVTIDIAAKDSEGNPTSDSDAYGENSIKGDVYVFRGTAKDIRENPENEDEFTSGFDTLYYKFTTSTDTPAKPYSSFVKPTTESWSSKTINLESGATGSGTNVDTDEKLFEGKKYLWVYGVDKAGNASTPQYVAFMVDQKKPEFTNLKVCKNTNGTELTEKEGTSTIYITSEDTASYTLSGKVWDANGISKLVIETVDANTQAKTTAELTPDSDWNWSKTFSDQGSFIHTIVAYDGSGKTAETGRKESISKSIIFDKNAPTISVTGFDETNPIWISGTGDYYFNGTAGDVGSGLKEISIRIDGSGDTDYEKLPLSSNWNYKFPLNHFEENDETTNHTVYVKAIDNADNTTINSYNFRYDKAAPQANLTLNKNGQYVNDLSSVTLSGHAHDGVSGRALKSAKIIVKKDGVVDSSKEMDVTSFNDYDITATTGFGTFSKSNFSSYDNGLKNDDGIYVVDGTYDFELVVEDKAGKSPASTSTLTASMIVDKTPPVANHNIATTGVNVGDDANFKFGENVYNENGLLTNKDTIQFSGKFTDSGSGVKRVYYWIFNSEPAIPDGEKTFAEYQSAFTSAIKTGYVAAYAVSGSANTYGFDAMLSGFAEGKNHIVLVAVDNAGNAKLDNVIYKYELDKTLPQANLSLNKNGQYVNAGAFAVDDSANPPKTGIIISGFAHDGRAEAQDSNPAKGRAVKTATLTAKNGSIAKNIPVTLTSTKGSTFGDFSKTLEVSDFTVNEQIVNGTWNFTLYVEDQAGNKPDSTSTVSASMIIDTENPESIVAKFGDITNGTTSIHSNNAKVTVNVSFNEANPEAVYYYINDGSNEITDLNYKTAISDGDWIAMTLNATAKTASKNFSFNDGAGKVYIKVVDKAGNAGYLESPLTYAVDTKQPDVCTLDKVDGVTLEGSKLINGENDVTFTVNASDYNDNYITDTTTSEKAKIGADASKIKSVNLKTIGSQSVSVTGVKQTGGEWMVDIAKENFTNLSDSCPVTVTVTDDFDNAKDFQVFTIDVDSAKPTIKNYNLASAYDAKLQPDKTDATKNIKTYYMSNKKVALDLSGVAEDNREIDVVRLTLKKNGTAIIKNGDKNYFESSLSGWTFTLNTDEWKNLTGFVSAEITVIDKAKNVCESPVRFQIIFDNDAPAAKHLLDKKGKDLYFRVGDMNNDDINSSTTPKWTTGTDDFVGGKYSKKSYGNSETIRFHGNYSENGSGLKMIYYKRFDHQPEQSEINSFLSGYEADSSNTGSFAPKSETKRVFYNDTANPDATNPLLIAGTSTDFPTDNKVTSVADGSEKYWASITSDFVTTISGFSEGKNYLVFVAVDNVGNAAVDKITMLKDNSETETEELSYFQINVDTATPAITLSSPVLTEGSNTIYTNSSSMKLVLYVTDSIGTNITNCVPAGIKSVEVTINNVKKPADLNKTSTDANYGKWEVEYSSLSAGEHDISVKAIDYADNPQTTSVAKLVVDNEEPTVKLNAISDADLTEANTQINGKINISGSSEDDKGVNKVLGVCYKIAADATKPEKQTGAVNAAWTVPEGWTKVNTSLKSDSTSASWTFENINTVNLSGSATINDNSTVWFSVAAQDIAGNVGYSTPVKVIVDQNTDRPRLSFTNLPWDTDGVKHYNTNLSKITGTIADDDGISGLYIANTAAKPATLKSDSYKVNVGNDGSFEITVSDGSQKLWIYVEDKENGKFETSAEKTLNQPYLIFNGHKDTNGKDIKENASEAISFIINNTAPTNVVPKFGYSSANTVEPASYSEFAATNYVGGTVRKYVKFSVTADTTENVPIGSVAVNGNGGTAQITFTEDSASGAWYSNYVDLSTWDESSYNLTFIITDASGLSKTETKSITVDNTGPSISLTSPKVEVTGSVELVGTSNDINDVTKIGYVVVNNQYYNAAETLKTDAMPNIKIAARAAVDSLVKTGTTSTWSFILGKDSEGNDKNAGLPASSEAITNATTGINLCPQFTSNDLDTRKIAIVFYAVDSLGNESFTPEKGSGAISIIYNPYGDRPKSEVTYPNGSYGTASNVEGYSNLSGAVRITGSAKDNNSINSGKVFLQLDVNNDGQFTAADVTILKGLKFNGSDIYTIVEDASTITGLTNASALGDATAQAAFWGILVKGTNSWNYSINTYNELQIPSALIGGTGSGVYKIGVRAVAMDDTGVMGSWSAAQYFKLDLNAPTIGSAKIYSLNDSGAVIEDQVPVSYEQDMYLSGGKVLRISISDKEGLSSVRYTYAKTLEELNTSTDSGTATLGTPVVADGTKTYTVDIPLSALTASDKLNSNTVALKVVATKASDTDTTSYERYLVHFDNDAPVIKNLTLNGKTFADSDKKIVNSNGYFTIGGQSEDTGAGFERMSYYFMRNPGTTINDTRIYDLMIAPNETGTPQSQPNYISTSGLATRTVTIGTGENAESFTIYGETQELEVSTDGNSLSGYTTTDSHVREGSYVQIGSTWHKIKEISNSTITLATPTTATGSQEVFFAYMQTIDNTGSEKAVNGNVTKENGDDGDGMPESIIKSQNIWNYDASFFSNYIPDGPGILVTFVYDRAGNVTAQKYEVSVQNKAPRLTKLWLSTDLNRDGKFRDIPASGLTEIVEYNVLSKVGEQTNYKDMKTKDYHGERFIIKNKFAVIPEFTGGNGDIYMALNNAAESNSNPTALSSTTYTTQAAAVAALYSSQGATAVPDIASFTLALTGDSKLAYVIDNNKVGAASYDSSDGSEKDRAMSFTFWDSTEDTISGVNSNWCYLRINDLVVNVTDQKAPNTVVEPFFWNSHDDNSLYQDSYENGHIELVEEGSTDDPQVSGKISIRGWAFDDHTLGSIWAKFDDFTPAAGTADADGYYKLASYANGNWTSYATSTAISGSTWAFSVTPDYLGQAGHKVHWQLDIDTSAITGAMGNNKKVYIRAIDATGSATDATPAVVSAHTSSETAKGTSTSSDSEYNKPSYQMDVVPYISGISTDKAGNNPATRSRLGRYPVRAGDTIYIKGFNFGTGTISVTRRKTAANGTMAAPTPDVEIIAGATREDANTISITAPAKSGFIHLMIGGIEASNNKNDNDKGYNIEAGFKAKETTNGVKTYGRTAANTAGTNFWTDDRYLSVWNTGTYFEGSASPHSGTLKKFTANDLDSGKLYKQQSKSQSILTYNNMRDHYMALWGSDDMLLYSSIKGSTERAISLYTDSEYCFYIPPEAVIYTVIGGIPYYVLRDDWVGGNSANSWGTGLVLAREGYVWKKGTLDSTQSLTENDHRNIIEREGNNNPAASRNSSGGYDSVLKQFTNFQMTGYYASNEIINRENNSPVNGVDYVYVSYYDSYARCLKYAAYKAGHRTTTIDSSQVKWGQQNGYQDLIPLMRTAGEFNENGTAIHSTAQGMTGGYSVVAGNDTTSNNPTSFTEQAGEWSDIVIDPVTKTPVIVYYNKTAGNIEIAHAGIRKAPSNGQWIKTTNLSKPEGSSDFGRYVSCAVDNSGNLHVTAQDASNGRLYYMYLTKDSSTYTYTVTKTVLVDATGAVGRWTDIELTTPSATGEAALPVISYLDTTYLNTTKAIKVAYYDSGNACWDALTDCAVYEGYDTKLSVMADVYESTDANSNKSKIGVGFNSNMLAVDFLRDE